MELNTGNISNATLRKTLTNGLIDLILGNPKIRETVIYQRFLKAPHILSFTVGAVLLGAGFQFYLWLFSGFWGGFCVPFFCLPLILIAGGVRAITKAILIRERMWVWGKDKFSSWDEFSAWLDKTPGGQLDLIASYHDDSWLPDLAKGGAYEGQT